MSRATFCFRCGQLMHAGQASAKITDSSGYNFFRHINCPTKENPMNASIDSILDTATYAHRRMQTEAIINSGEPFYIVFNPTSEKPSKMAFKTQDEAFQVATLMARKNLDEQFFVLRTVGFAQTQQPVVVSHFNKELSTTVVPKAAPKTRKRS